MTNNLLLPMEGFKVLKGILKTYIVIAETGNTMTSFFCGDCGSTLYRKSSHSDAAVAVMLGCIDDDSVLENAKPDIEGFVRCRPGWMTAVDGAKQEQGAFMPKFS